MVEMEHVGEAFLPPTTFNLGFVILFVCIYLDNEVCLKKFDLKKVGLQKNVVISNDNASTQTSHPPGPKFIDALLLYLLHLITRLV